MDNQLLDIDMQIENTLQWIWHQITCDRTVKDITKSGLHTCICEQKFRASTAGKKCPNGRDSVLRLATTHCHKRAAQSSMGY